MPLAHIMSDSNKARYQLGYHTQETFQAGVLVPEETWFSVAQFDVLNRQTFWKHWTLPLSFSVLSQAILPP